MPKKKLVKRKKEKKIKSLWKGPYIEGVSQSMLGSFILCRERFRVQNVLGWGPPDQLCVPIEYGSMWHLCKEKYLEGKDYEEPLKKLAQKLIKKYKIKQIEIAKWYAICRIQFPIYLQYWKDRKSKYHPLSAEEKFVVPYTLPSGRIVILRGKRDGVFADSKSKKSNIYLMENKTKSSIDKDALNKQLMFDMQTMIYLITLKEQHPEYGDRIKGVLYNVIKRPLSGGKGSIRQHKPTKTNPQGESLEHFYDRLRTIIIEDKDEFFARWQVDILPSDIKKFKDTFLHPQLEALCDWWDFISENVSDPWTNNKGLHYRTPYGLYNILSQGGTTDLDEYLNTGSLVGLEKQKTLFPELQEEEDED
jgi:hypothetical protein